MTDEQAVICAQWTHTDRQLQFKQVHQSPVQKKVWEGSSSNWGQCTAAADRQTVRQVRRLRSRRRRAHRRQANCSASDAQKKSCISTIRCSLCPELEKRASVAAAQHSRSSSSLCTNCAALTAGGALEKEERRCTCVWCTLPIVRKKRNDWAMIVCNIQEVCTAVESHRCQQSPKEHHHLLSFSQSQSLKKRQVTLRWQIHTLSTLCNKSAHSGTTHSTSPTFLTLTAPNLYRRLRLANQTRKQ